jgi:hypothetical protein
MHDDLDALMGRLARASADHGLGDLEAAVMSGVARERSARNAARALVPAQAAAVAVAVGLGLAAGGMFGLSAARPPAAGMLPTQLAPSTLLAANR